MYVTSVENTCATVLSLFVIRTRGVTPRCFGCMIAELPGMEFQDMWKHLAQHHFNVFITLPFTIPSYIVQLLYVVFHYMW